MNGVRVAGISFPESIGQWAPAHLKAATDHLKQYETENAATKNIDIVVTHRWNNRYRVNTYNDFTLHQLQLISEAHGITINRETVGILGAEPDDPGLDKQPHACRHLLRPDPNARLRDVKYGCKRIEDGEARSHSYWDDEEALLAHTALAAIADRDAINNFGKAKWIHERAYYTVDYHDYFSALRCGGRVTTDQDRIFRLTKAPENVRIFGKSTMVSTFAIRNKNEKHILGATMTSGTVKRIHRRGRRGDVYEIDKVRSQSTLCSESLISFGEPRFDRVYNRHSSRFKSAFLKAHSAS